MVVNTRLQLYRILQNTATDRTKYFDEVSKAPESTVKRVFSGEGKGCPIPPYFCTFVCMHVYIYTYKLKNFRGARGVEPPSKPPTGYAYDSEY